MTYHMPAETARHERTWMSFPPRGYVLGDDVPGGSKEAEREGIAMWSRVANAISRYEPVSMLVDPALLDTAREHLDSSITISEFALDDCWMRDSGPTFVFDCGDSNGSDNFGSQGTDDSSATGSGSPSGSLVAVDWIFNGWGQQDWSRWDHDELIAKEVARLAGTPVLHSDLVLEGGGFHVDGEGTAILTETVPLDPGRNPGATKALVERELHSKLGIDKVIWLPRGLTRDYSTFGTRGHIDIVATMPQPGMVVVHEQRDPNHPDYEVSRDLIARLQRARDARGRQLTVVPIPAPQHSFDDDGQPNDYSYVNHYAANGAVIACVFEDGNDDEALDVLAQAYPGREIVPIPARPLFERGGGIHCITQQQPYVADHS
jgi:agmatine deiminase